MAEDSKMTLGKIQQWMQGALLDPYGSDNQSLEQIIRSSERLAAHQHLAIYQRSYVARLRECMSKQFPALEYALGKRLFTQFADQYLQTYPSKSYTLQDLGKNFAQFLEETRPDRDAKEKEDWPDFLIELATFEYHIQILFDQVNSKKYSPANMDSPDEELDLVPVLQFFEFQFPVSYYFQSFKREEEPELPFGKPSWCVIYRHNFRIGILGLSYWQYQLLSHFKANGNLHKALERIAEESNHSLEEVSHHWEQWKKFWIKEGMLCLMESN